MTTNIPPELQDRFRYINERARSILADAAELVALFRDAELQLSDLTVGLADDTFEPIAREVGSLDAWDALTNLSCLCDPSEAAAPGGHSARADNARVLAAVEAVAGVECVDALRLGDDEPGRAVAARLLLTA